MGKAKTEYVYGPILKCKQCGSSFQPRDKASKAKYCSYACNNASRRIHHERPCATCGKVFTPIRNGWVTCSRECGTKYRVSRHIPDPMVAVRRKMALHCCSVIHRCLRAKTDRTHKMLGYKVNELISHLEKQFTEGMGWDNYGNKAGRWSIDHIRPISSFPQSATIAEINALSNLQPLWHSENCRKKNKWDVQ